MSTYTLKIIFPIVILFGAVAIAAILIFTRPEVAQRPMEVTRPLIRTFTVEKADLEMTVQSQGTVVPRTESSLIAQIAGQVTFVAPAFAAGGFFDKNEVLVKIDDRDYELAKIQAEAQVAQAELRYEREQEEARIAKNEWQRLGKGEASQLVLRAPQLKEALASLNAAKARLKQAEINVQRTKIRAPFTGRLRQKNVDVGQYVNPGIPLAVIYAVDYAEIRLPIPDAQLAYLDLPLNFRDETLKTNGPRVTLSASFAGSEHAWQAHIVRVEGEIDARSRMVHAVARIQDPYGHQEKPNTPPLAVGLFVKAQIHGKILNEVTAIPRVALRDKNMVLVLENNESLQYRKIEIARIDDEKVVVSSGLSTGEKVCISPLEAVVNGMQVRVHN
ncbi:MAG: efflux RND transporter periplasmic adaptor subunit [Calditrichaeota bacterium]|nr:MAG: efflux RND transporter periplasmic adaptor subunit [Calditrichota bacterium]